MRTCGARVPRRPTTELMPNSDRLRKRLENFVPPLRDVGRDTRTERGCRMTSHIELGHALITMVEPHRESVVAYNRWYEHDHALSGVMTGPGAFSYRRFVATRELKERRFPEDSPIAQ